MYKFEISNFIFSVYPDSRSLHSFHGAINESDFESQICQTSPKRKFYKKSFKFKKKVKFRNLRRRASGR